MISESAKHSIDGAFSRAASACLALGEDDCVDVRPLTGPAKPEAGHRNILVLTISSFLFRLVTVFHVTPESRILRYFGRGDEQRPFHETFGEIGNLCCGAMNRELGSHFPHLGMSTPHLLGGGGALHLDSLGASHTSRHLIPINGDMALMATLCLCAYAPLDFRIDAPSEPNSGGDIEFF